MNVVTLSSKYQVVIPIDIRESQGWKPGDHISVYVSDDGTVQLRRVPTFRELRGSLRGKITVPFVRDKEHE